MSRKNKNLRAFLHQNPDATVEEAWNAAWESAQKRYHAKSMATLTAERDRLREALEGMLNHKSWVDGIYIADTAVRDRARAALSREGE